MRSGIDVGRALRAIAAAGAATTLYAWRESKNVELTRTVIRVAGLPPGLEGLRILHVADTHFPGNGESLPRFLEAVASSEYDIVLATGDYAETSRGWPVVVEAFRRIEPKLGVYAVIGAHERYGAPSGWREAVSGARRLLRHTPRRLVDPAPLIEELEAVGVQVLVNASATVEISGEMVRLVGIDDAYIGLDDVAGALQRRGSGGPSGGSLEGSAPFSILLSHSPDGVLHARDHEFPLALCGHTHGGQIRLPFYGAPVRHAKAVDRVRTAGLMRIGATPTYVSRGFGTATLPLRFGCRPELGVIELRSR